MKRIGTFILIVCALALSVLGQEKQQAPNRGITGPIAVPAPNVPPSRRIPPAQAQQLKDAQGKIEQLQKEIQLQQLAAQNIVLQAALELGMTKAELAESVIAVDAEGSLIFVKRPPPAKKD